MTIKPNTRDILLIGGSHDGALLHLQDGISSVRMPKKTRVGVLPDYPLTKHEAPIPYEEEIYHRESFVDADGAPQFVMIFEGEKSPFARLLKGYAPGDKEAAERYRCLREQNWHDSPLCVATWPRQTVRLGTFCPSGALLDEAVDRIRYGIEPGTLKN